MENRKINKAALLLIYDWDRIRRKMLGKLKKLGRDIPIVSEDEVDGELAGGRKRL